MNQSRIESMIETILNVGSGFVLSLVFWIWVIMPYFHLELRFMQNVGLTCAFTVLSVVRGYIWRRVFNAQVHRRVHTYVSKWRKR